MSDRIVTHPSNDAYRSGYDAIFGKLKAAQDARSQPTRDDQASIEQRVGAGQKSSD